MEAGHPPVGSSTGPLFSSDTGTPGFITITITDENPPFFAFRSMDVQGCRPLPTHSEGAPGG